MSITRFFGMVILLAAPAGVAAQESAGRWQSVEEWPSGGRIIIIVASGEIVDGAFKYANPEGLVVTGPGGNERRIPKAEVRQVKAVKKDSRVNGLLLGAAAGAGFGVLVGYDRRTFECPSGCSIAIGTTLFTPAGALVGWLRDRKRNHVEVIYDAH